MNNYSYDPLWVTYRANNEKNIWINHQAAHMSVNSMPLSDKVQKLTVKVETTIVEQIMCAKRDKFLEKR